jgi:hypothetical protein
MSFSATPKKWRMAIDILSGQALSSQTFSSSSHVREGEGLRAAADGTPDPLSYAVWWCLPFMTVFAPPLQLGESISIIFRKQQSALRERNLL